MIRIAIVENEEEDASFLKNCIMEFGKNYDGEFDITIFSDGLFFITNYNSGYDIVLMDIDMPLLDGMETAKKMRELDEVTPIIFITNLAQYAIKGYEVNALDYIVKPVSYYDFTIKFRRALNKIKGNSGHTIRIKTDSGFAVVALSDLMYIEVVKHSLYYHTVDRVYKTYAPMKSVEESLKTYGFAKCNNCYLVNLRYVRGLSGQMLQVGDEEIVVSHPRRKEFLQELNVYLGTGGGHSL